MILLGRLSKDTELKGTVLHFTVAVDRKVKAEGKPTADFISCTAFGKTAEFINKFFHKGQRIALEGRIETGSYEKDGKKVYTTEVIVESAEFAESKKTDDNKAIDFVPIPENDPTLPFE